uniref:Uncharacterized protein n=1 Tax=Nelumbo nucifera TaxID=4432 RepID=A0A822YBQ3_NELNU|nr:TPA_asm: hypothetical protein HUJ06_010395 [Nelumbo nucifera]
MVKCFRSYIFCYFIILGGGNGMHLYE